MKGKKNNKKARARLRALMLLVVLAGVIVSLFVFFKIETIEVRGQSRYTDAQIAEAGDLSVGDSLLRFLSSNREKLICSRLPYIQSVEIKRSLPDRLVIEVEPVSEIAAVYSGGTYYIISTDGKLLEITGYISEMPVIIGVEVEEGAEIGSALPLSDELDSASKMMQQMIRIGLFDKMSLIDASNSLELVLVYDRRAKVIIGTGSNLEYKMDMLTEVMENRESPDFAGVVDLSKAGEAVVRDDKSAIEDYSSYIQ